MLTLDIISFIEDENVIQWIGLGLLTLLILYVVRFLLRHFITLLNKVVYILIKISCSFFSIFNRLQRFLSKPWRIFYKYHHGGNGINRFMRGFWFLLKIPLYVFLTPLRLANAICYNILLHISFEFFNYLAEICDPSSKKEGGANFATWLTVIPWRLIKYGWHFLLVVVESVVWTVIDTFIPALTLYHGTTREACKNIIESPGRLWHGDRDMGVWLVGGGNFAGDGIYFAPVRSTAEHYARGYMIVCRVSLGRVIDLGMAPKYVFNYCGHSNAHEVTRWGLDHKYTTGEWWRSGTGWWEYCMYDRGGRYDYSWRIRPLYVEEIGNRRIFRIRGGMVHWLFRKMVFRDLRNSFH